MTIDERLEKHEQWLADHERAIKEHAEWAKRHDEMMAKIDARLDRLTERHEALTISVEHLVAESAKHERQNQAFMKAFRQVARALIAGLEEDS